MALNDKVAAGDLLVRLDDEELIGRVNAALAEAAVRKRERDNAELSPASRAGAQIRRGRRRQRRAPARAGPRGVRSRATRRAAAGGRRSRRRQGARCRRTRPRSGSSRRAPRLRKALAADELPAPTRPEAALAAARADLVRRPKRRSSARASGPPLPARSCRSTPRPARPRRPRPRTSLVVVGDLSVAAGQGRDRGARHRQDARRPGRDRALRRLPRQGLRGQDRLPGAGAGAEPARPARAAQADRRRRARGADRSRRPAAAAAGHARRRVPQARRDGERRRRRIEAPPGAARSRPSWAHGVTPRATLGISRTEIRCPAIETFAGTGHVKRWPWLRGSVVRAAEVLHKREPANDVGALPRLPEGCMLARAEEMLLAAARCGSGCAGRGRPGAAVRCRRRPGALCRGPRQPVASGIADQDHDGLRHLRGDQGGQADAGDQDRLLRARQQPVAQQDRPARRRRDDGRDGAAGPDHQVGQRRGGDAGRGGVRARTRRSWSA